MRTCYDSASALAQLINYIGNDTQRQFDLNNTLSKKSPMLSDSNETLCQNDEISSTLIEGITNVNPTPNNVNLLLAEAVQETSINFDITTSMKTSKGEQLIEQNAINIPDYEAFDVIAFESSLSDTRNVKCTGDEMEMFQERHTPLESSILTYHMFDSSESASQELHFKSDDDYCIIDEKNASTLVFRYHHFLALFSHSEKLSLDIAKHHLILYPIILFSSFNRYIQSFLMCFLVFTF